MKKLALTLVTLVVVGLPGLAHAQLLSPGPLSEPHKDIDGDDDCSKCHSEGKQVVASKCLACHDALARKINAQTGLHGIAYKGKDCESCHIEHNGRKFKLVRWPGGDMAKLDHDDTGWKLEGAHQKTKCLDCHKQTTRGGRSTFLGAAKQCATCHKDPHAGQFGSTCTACHTQVVFTDLRLDKFQHDLAKYALKGKHKQVKCAACHGEPAKWKGLQFGACRDCHEDVHKGRFKQKCESCHTVASWQQVDDTIRQNHPGVSIGGGHKKVACKDCHDKGNDRPPSKGSACVDCHPVIHEAPFGKQCASCHVGIRWLGLGREVGLSSHKRTTYPLTGLHVKVDCDKCHPTSKSANARYRKLTFDKCGACHEDKHGGEFVRQDGGECAACHTTAGFRPTSFGLEQHGKTAFPLAGRHQAASCTSCHPTVKGKPRLDLRVAKKACADCHDNPHGNQFAKEMADGGCAHCHGESEWKRAKFDHSTWPLTGGHERAACVRCHGTVADSSGGKLEAAKYRGIPRECEGCHEDVHAGQFRLSEPIKACDACHSTDLFQIAVWDHGAHTDYPLEGKHAQVACKGCHVKEELRSGVVAVRYRLGYRGCKDCHASPHKEEQR